MLGPRPGGLLAFLVVVALLSPLSLFSVDVRATGVDETPGPEWVEAQFNITFVSFSNITADVRYDVYEADLGVPTGVPASTFRSRLSSEPAVKKEYLDKAEQDLWTTINGTLGSLKLQNATVNVAPAAVRSLGQNVTGDIYRQPVSIGTSAQVTINPACLGLSASASVDRLVRGTLVMGGILNLSVDLRAQTGHLNKFHIVPPAGFYFRAGLALTSTSELSIDARNSTVALTDHTNLVLVSGAPAKLKARIDALANVDVQELDHVTLSVDVSIYAVDSTKISPHFPSVLGIYLVSADGLRMAVDQGLLSWADIKDLAVQSQVDALQKQLSGMMAGPLTLTFEWDQGSLTGYNVGTMVGGPVKAKMTGSGSLDLKGMSRHIADEALWSGARVPFKVDISNDLNWSVQMTLPKNLTLEGTGLAPTGAVGDREVYRWSKAVNPLNGHIARNGTWEPGQNGTVTVTIQLSNVDYDLIKVLGQQRTSFRFRVSVSVYLQSLPLDYDIKSSLPAGVTLDRANADLIRALIAEGKLDKSKIDSLVEDLSRQIKMQLSAALDKDVDFRVFIDQPTLGVNATGPIVLKGSADVTVEKSLNTQDSFGNLIDTAKRFYLQGRDGWTVTYKIGMPEGVEIYDVRRTLKASEFKVQPTVSKDKRTMVEVLDGELDDNVTIYVRPTFEKSIAEALPQPVCFMSIILVVVLIVGTVYYLRLRKRRALERAKDERRRRTQARPARRDRHDRAHGVSTLDRYGQNLEGYRKLQPHVHQHRLPLRHWKSEEGTEEEELPRPTRTVQHTVDRTPPPMAAVPLAQPKPYLPQKPAEPTTPKHITGAKERFVTCPACKRKFPVHPEAEVLECPHCGKKGKAAPKKPHITGARPATRSIKCPRCGSLITYGEEQEAIKCIKCGKEGRVKKRT